jgi:hypothetical protein
MPKAAQASDLLFQGDPTLNKGGVLATSALVHVVHVSESCPACAQFSLMWRAPECGQKRKQSSLFFLLWLLGHNIQIKIE